MGEGGGARNLQAAATGFAGPCPGQDCLSLIETSSMVLPCPPVLLRKHQKPHLWMPSTLAPFQALGRYQLHWDSFRPPIWPLLACGV